MFAGVLEIFFIVSASGKSIIQPLLVSVLSFYLVLSSLFLFRLMMKQSSSCPGVLIYLLMDYPRGHPRGAPAKQHDVLSPQRFK